MQGIHEAELVEVIRVVETVGTGTEGNAVRQVVSYWTADGQLIARLDPIDGNESQEQLPL